MLNHYKLSIITINFNNKTGLIKTIESVRNQTFQDFEYIVIDGGSKDGSKAYLETHQNTFTYWISEPDKGVYHAMNKGIDKAKGDYCYFLNSGDVFFDKRVLEKFNLLRDNSDLMYGRIKVLENITEFPEKVNLNYFIKSTISHQSCFIKRLLFLEYGNYDEDLKFVSDWKFFALIFFNPKTSCKRLDLNVAIYDNSGLTSTPTNLKAMYEEFDIEKLKLFHDFYSKLISQIPETTKLNLSFFWKALSDFVKLNDDQNTFSVDQQNKTLFLETCINYLVEHSELEIRKHDDLKDSYKNSASYTIGNKLIQPLYVVRKFLK